MLNDYNKFEFLSENRNPGDDRSEGTAILFGNRTQSGSVLEFASSVIKRELANLDFPIGRPKFGRRISEATKGAQNI